MTRKPSFNTTVLVYQWNSPALFRTHYFVCSCKFEFEWETLEGIKKAEDCRPLQKEEIRTHVHSHFKSYFHVHKDTVASNESGNHPTDLPENHRRTVVKDGGMDA